MNEENEMPDMVKKTPLEVNGYDLTAVATLSGMITAIDSEGIPGRGKRWVVWTHTNPNLIPDERRLAFVGGEGSLPPGKWVLVDVFKSGGVPGTYTWHIFEESVK